MTLVLVSVLFYLLATGLLVTGLQGNRSRSRYWAWPAVVALVAHALVHAHAWQDSGGADMHFFAALSLVGLGMALLTTLVGLGGRMAALGVVVYPLASTMLLLCAAKAHGATAATPLDWRLQLHAWLALLAYATLAVSALLAIMLWLQERALRRRQLATLLHAFPPLTMLESLLFRLIGAGFALLTLALLAGVVFVEDLSAQHLVHKFVLSLLAWAVFAALLFGRLRYGWRGRRAVRLTLIAMALLGLAFFGSKAVLELVLQRSA